MSFLYACAAVGYTLAATDQHNPVGIHLLAALLGAWMLTKVR